MTISDKLQLCGLALVVIGSIFGTVYGAVRMAIRAEIGRVETKVAETYVTHDTCRAIREDCRRWHEARAGNARAQEATP